MSKNWDSTCFLVWFLKKPIGTFFHLEARQWEWDAFCWSDLGCGDTSCRFSKSQVWRNNTGDWSLHTEPDWTLLLDAWIVRTSPEFLNLCQRVPMERQQATIYGDQPLGIWCGALRWSWRWVFVLAVQLEPFLLPKSATDCPRFLSQSFWSCWPEVRNYKNLMAIKAEG